MPFEVFRRHQRKLLAVLAILAMFGFVVYDSLPRLLSPSYAAKDQAVVKLYGKTLNLSSLNEMREQRMIANRFFSQLDPSQPEPFGGVKQRDLVDALILQHEADRLGMPATPEMGRELLSNITNDEMTRDRFEQILSRLNIPVSSAQVLGAIANQVRLAKVRQLLRTPLVTPYDVFRAYREENERVSAKAVEIPVEKFLARVAEPSQEELEAEYLRYKEILPNPERDTPGFKIPREIQVEILSVDGNALARSIKDKLAESELRTAYENRKSEFQERGELPTDLFAGQPELTPPVLRPFADVRATLAASLSEEKAQAEIIDKFTKIREEVLIPFADKNATALEEIEEAKKQGRKKTIVPPAWSDLKDHARREGLNHEITPLLSRDKAERYGEISSAEVGLSRQSGGRKFAEEFFDPKKSLYEPAEFTDILGTRYLARKIKDVPPHVPPLDEIRPEVSLAWKMTKARPLAEKAASELAEQLKKKGGTLKDAMFEGYRVISIPPIPRRQSSFVFNRLERPAIENTPIPDIPHAGEPFRDAYFGLQAGSPAVASNDPKNVYYVLTLDRREPATFTALYAPNSDEFRYKFTAMGQAARRLDQEWMGWLRQQAGVEPDWVPPDEVRKSAPDEG